MIPAKVALANNATCNGPSAAAVPNSTMVKTSRAISTTTGARASSSEGSRGGGRAGTAGPGGEIETDIPCPFSCLRGAARAFLGRLDVGDEGVVGESGGFLVRVAGVVGRGEQDLQCRAVVRRRRGVDLDLQPRAVAGPGHLLGGVAGAGQQGRGQAGDGEQEERALPPGP